MKKQVIQESVIVNVDTAAVDTLTAELAAVVAPQNELNEAIFDADKKLDEELELSQAKIQAEAVQVASTDNGVAAMLLTDTNAQMAGGAAAASGGALGTGVSTGVLVAGGLGIAAVAVVATDDDDKAATVVTATPTPTPTPTPVADTAPEVAATQSVTAPENGSAPITVAATDEDGDTLTYTPTNGNNGVVSLSGQANQFTYTPTAGYSGPDSFTVTVSDEDGNSVVQTINVTITAAPLTPAETTFDLKTTQDTVPGTASDDTINAKFVSTGAVNSTFTAFDAIDGAAGSDTFNIFTDNVTNTAFPGTASVKNVEIVNIFNGGTSAASAFADASKFVGVTTLTQHGLAADVTKLAATTTAGFKDVTAATAVDLEVSAAAAATSAAVALNGVKGDVTTNTAELNVTGVALTAVTVSGTLAQTTVNTTAANLALNVAFGKDVQAVTINTALKTTLGLFEGTGSTKEVSTVDASSSTGDITYAGTVTGGTIAPSTIKTGSGADVVTIIAATLKDNAVTTTVDETLSALVETGAGKDTLTINTTGTGTTTANSGAGDDTVTLNADGTGKLTVNLGAGNDAFNVSGTGGVSGTDAIDGGAGTDTLLLSLVGSANVGAFTNFEVFDAAGLGKTLDVDILATNNTVTEFVATADVGSNAILTNVGAGIGYRVTGDTVTGNALTLTQKTAGALTVTLDIDETGTAAATTASNARDASVVASNATSINAVFDSAFVGASTGAGDNATDLNVTGTKATSLTVVSGGTGANNDLDYVSGANTGNTADLLTSVTITGAANLDVSILESSANSAVTAIDASAFTGNLTISTAELKAESAVNTFDGGSLTLGSGDDVVTGVQGAKIVGIEKGTAEDATIQTGFDVISIGGALQAADLAAANAAPVTIKDGLLTFEGAGPTTLADAITLASDNVTTASGSVAFEYVGNSYVFNTGGNTGAGNAGDDSVIQLTGVTGLVGLDAITAGSLYVI